MKNKRISISLFLIWIPMFSSLIYSQQNPSKGGKDTAFELKGESLFYDEEGNEINGSIMNDSLRTTKYTIVTKQSNGKNIIQLRRKNPKIGELINQVLPSFDGDDLKITHLLPQDSMTIISFWSTRCPPCIRELAVFNWLATDFPDIRFIAVTTDSSSEVAIFLEKHNLKWECITFYNNYKGSLEVNALPTTFILDKKGIIRTIYVDAKLREIIVSLDALSKSNIP